MPVATFTTAVMNCRRICEVDLTQVHSMALVASLQFHVRFCNLFACPQIEHAKAPNKTILETSVECRVFQILGFGSSRWYHEIFQKKSSCAFEVFQLHLALQEVCLWTTSSHVH